MCLLQINKKECLHCGKHPVNYCEECFQELITEITDLKLRNQSLKDSYIKSINKNIDLNDEINRLKKNEEEYLWEKKQMLLNNTRK